MNLSDKLKKSFPLSAKYDEEWVRAHSLGENVLYNMEALTQHLDLKPGMRVLDLACGQAVSSIFLAREFDVQVWAIDAYESATDNHDLIISMDCENKVFPLKADAKSLPFANDFFDVVTVVDSITYFGTDDKYLPYLASMVRKDGQIGIVDIAIENEINSFDEVPELLRSDYTRYWYYVHSLPWWCQLWEKTGLVKLTHAETLAQSNLIRSAYIRDAERKGEKDPFAKALEMDDKEFLSFFCLVAKRTEKQAVLDRYS